MEALIVDNEKNINITIYNTLGEEYKLLPEDAIGQLYLLACEKIDVLKTHEQPKAWFIVAARFVAKGMLKKHLAELTRVSSIECDSSYDLRLRCILLGGQ